MMFDSYSHYSKKAGTKHCYLLDRCTSFYDTIHRRGKRKPSEIPLYVSIKPDAIECHSKREPALGLTGAGGKYLSGLFIPDVSRPELAYGDHEQDALILISKNDELELFISKGKKNCAGQLLSMVIDGDPDLTAEIEESREKAKQQPNQV